MQNFIHIVKKYLRDIILFGLILICFALIAYQFYFQDDEQANESSIALLTEVVEEEQLQDAEENEFVNVDVKGAVKSPGVYKVESTAIINDVITLAGGFKSTAYSNGINLSKKVSDEMVIYVYTKSEIKALKQENTNTTATSATNEACEISTYDITDCTNQGSSVIEATNSSNSSGSSSSNASQEESENSSTQETQLVNINTATLSELMTLSGIGEAKAQAIIDYREENGNFSDISGIMNVSGIGEAMYAKIKDYITV